MGAIHTRGVPACGYFPRNPANTNVVQQVLSFEAMHGLSVHVLSPL